MQRGGLRDDGGGGSKKFDLLNFFMKKNNKIALRQHRALFTPSPFRLTQAKKPARHCHEASEFHGWIDHPAVGQVVAGAGEGVALHIQAINISKENVFTSH